MEISLAQIASFHADGFLRIDQPLASSGELSLLRDIYDRLFARDAGKDDGHRFDLSGTDLDGGRPRLPQILFPDRYEPDLCASFFDKASAIARQLLGAGAQTRIFHAILKPAGYGAPTPWHQDEAYWEPDQQYRSLSMWMPLQLATVENGCLWFAPGSHEWDVLPHRNIGSDPRAHGLELCDASLIEDMVACPVCAGGLVIHRNRTAHYAGPNVTDQPRRALIMEAALPPRRYVGHRRFPWKDTNLAVRGVDV